MVTEVKQRSPMGLAIEAKEEFAYLDLESFSNREESMRDYELDWCLDCYNYCMGNIEDKRMAKYFALERTLEKFVFQSGLIFHSSTF